MTPSNTSVRTGALLVPETGFIAKFTPDGSQLLYCSYFGGGGDDGIWALAFDLDGNLCITGETDSRNFPLKNPLQPAFGGGPTTRSSQSLTRR